MNALYHSVLKPLLFQLDAEKAHYFAMNNLKHLSSLPSFRRALVTAFELNDDGLRTKVDGIEYANPVGLAAGFDKDGKYIQELALLGFGFIEVGTVTPRPQIGNPKPRIFRLKQDGALINRLGFNNEGHDALVRRLQNLDRSALPAIGVNIGKNKDTPNEQAWKDYEMGVVAFRGLADYYTINVSSPNTEGLRELQAKEALLHILGKCLEANEDGVPVYLKISPDETPQSIEAIIELAVELPIQGIVATNTTISRSPLVSDPKQVDRLGKGGLSGSPLTQRSNDLMNTLRAGLRGSGKTLIGSGGIISAAAAIQRRDTGADLVQVYTGFVYQGPQLIKDIKAAWLQGS